jgi:hypothetical protein
VFDPHPSPPPGAGRQSLAVDVARDFVVPALVVAAAAFALVPAPRWAAWMALLALPALVARRSTRSAGMTAAATAGMLYLAAHGRPRFATTVTDQLTIRLSFLLCILGAVGAATASWQRQRDGRTAS